MSETDGLWYTNPETVAKLPTSTASNVLLFGGTFDPPHVGHLTMARLASETLGCDEVWFLPAPSPPHKADITEDTFEWRACMVERLLEGRTDMRMMAIERWLPKPSYTVDTVRACRAWYPQIHFQFLLGADSLAQLPRWRDALTLSQEISFVVAARTGQELEGTLLSVRSELPEIDVTPLQMPLLDVSSSWLRDRLERGLDTCELIPERVLDAWLAGL